MLPKVGRKVGSAPLPASTVPPDASERASALDRSPSLLLRTVRGPETGRFTRPDAPDLEALAEVGLRRRDLEAKVASIDPDAIVFAQLATPAARLSPEATWAVIEHKLRALEKALCGVTANHPDFAPRYLRVQEAASRRFLAARERGESERSSLLVAYHRLVERAPGDFVAEIDVGAGRVCLSERVEPLFTPPATRRGAASGMELSGLDAGATLDLVAALEAVFPADALEILGRSATKLHLAESEADVSPTALQLFGEGCAIKDLTVGSGRYWPFLNEAAVPLLPELMGSYDAILSVIVHELAHALDWALGEAGQRFSDSPDWRRLFEDLATFPTERSRSDPAELFAESVAIYLLGRHVEVQPQRDQVTTRGDLMRASPDVFRALTQLLGAGLSERNRAGARLPAATAGIFVQRQLERVIRSEEKAPTFETAFHLAAWRLISAVVTRSTAALAEASSALLVARERERALNRGEAPYADAMDVEIGRVAQAARGAWAAQAGSLERPSR